MDRNKTQMGKFLYQSVALRKESVDRNTNVVSSAGTTGSRSPQGERG